MYHKMLVMTYMEDEITIIYDNYNPNIYENQSELNWLGLTIFLTIVKCGTDLTIC